MPSWGETSDVILATLNIDEQTVTYDALKTKFNEYFGIHKNTIAERTKFNHKKKVSHSMLSSKISSYWEYCDYDII